MTQHTAILEKKMNGIDVDRLQSTMEQIGENPDLAKFQFRATNQWINGTHNRAAVHSFFGAGQEHETRKSIVFDLDEPPVLCGNDLGANPAEYLLVAVSGCLTTTLISRASLQGIEIRGVRSRLEGDVDLRGFLGLSDIVPVEFQTIHISLHIDADISREMKQELLETAQKFSPIYNSISKSISICVQLDECATCAV